MRSDLRIVDFYTYNSYGWIIVGYRVRNESSFSRTVTINTEVNGTAVNAYDTNVAGGKSTGRIQPGQEVWIFRYYPVPQSAYALPHGTHYKVRATISLAGDAGFVLAQDEAEVPAHYWFYWYGYKG